MIRKSQIEYEAELYSFDPETRKSALTGLYHLLESGQVALVPELPIVNLHSHTFFSFNAYGYSPTGFAWEAKKRGLYAAGIIDFDVLDGIEEYLTSCELLGVRGVAGIESRVVVSEWKNLELNSPGEPGICYFMGYGFTRGTPEMREHHPALQKMAFLAQKRNRTMLEKLNGYLGGLAVDYERDVLPLTPSGNPTERHMLVALDRKAGEVYPDTHKRAHFWADAMGLKDDQIVELLERPVELQMLIRANLMKKGGPGYTAPDEESFPKLEEMIGMTRELGAAPTIGWLDGLSEGERDSARYLDFMIAKGACCLNIIPDRNWNISDERERKSKISKLHEIVDEARRRKLPMIAGTEMNKQGQKFVDDFTAEAMKTVETEFLKGARIMTGHTLMQKNLGFGITSREVEERFKGDLEKRNRFFETIGALKPVGGYQGGSERGLRVRQIWERGI